MIFRLTFLGTSASLPSAKRNHPALLVEAGGHRILVDCGEGTQRQLLRSGAGFRRLHRLLLTHAHFDHILGIPGLFSTLRLRQSDDLLTVHGGSDALDLVERMLAGLWGEGRAPIPLKLMPLTPGRFFDADEFMTDCFRFVTATLIAMDSCSKRRRAGTFAPSNSRPWACQTVQSGRNWQKAGL